MSLYDQEMNRRKWMMEASPFDAVMRRLNEHALPTLPSGNTQARPGTEQRAWKTIMGGGTVGNVVALTSATQSAQVVTVAGPNEQAQVMAVTLIPPLVPFGVVPAGGFGITSIGHDAALALIQWGVGGGVSSVEVDVSRGCTFSLVASSIRIFMRRVLEAGFPINPASPNLFGACISRGPIAAPTRATRSFSSRDASPGGLIPAATFIVTIPPYAKFLTMYSYVTGGGFVGERPMHIDLNTFNGVSCGQLMTGLNQDPLRVELPNQASFVIITNMSATETVDMQAVFELAL